MEYLSAGADMVLGKPVKVDMLRMLIRHVKEHGNFSMPDMMLWEEFANSSAGNSELQSLEYIRLQGSF
eukprot:gene32077-41596_t